MRISRWLPLLCLLAGCASQAEIDAYRKQHARNDPGQLVGTRLASESTDRVIRVVGNKDAGSLLDKRGTDNMVNERMLALERK